MQIPCQRGCRKSEKGLNEKVKVRLASGWGEAVLWDLFVFAGRGQLHSAFVFPAVYPVCLGLLVQVCVPLLGSWQGACSPRGFLFCFLQRVWTAF